MTVDCLKPRSQAQAGGANGVVTFNIDAAAANKISDAARTDPDIVSARFLPQRLVLDAGDDVGLGDEVFEEAVRLPDGHACGCEHVT